MYDFLLSKVYIILMYVPCKLKAQVVCALQVLLSKARIVVGPKGGEQKGAHPQVFGSLSTTQGQENFAATKLICSL